MGLQKLPSNPKPDSSPQLPLPSPSFGKVPQKDVVFSRSFGVYFSCSSAQVQSWPPDVLELLRLVEELCERESHLKIELFEHKLLRESVAIRVLKKEIVSKDREIERNAKKIECLEAENENQRQDLEFLHSKISEEKKEHEKKVKAINAEIAELKRALTESKKLVNSEAAKSDELSMGCLV